MAWVPSHMRKTTSSEDPVRLANSLLNKLTAERQLAISLEMKDFFEKHVHSSEMLSQMAQAIITKATREANYSKLYTELAISITEFRPDFKTSLLRVLQKSFLQLCQEKTIIRRDKRLLGYAAVIGEFYNQELLSQKVLFLNVANYFLEEMSEDTLGALCVLFNVSRRHLNASASGKESLGLYIKKLQEIYEDKNNGIGSRMRFLILDVIEDRR